MTGNGQRECLFLCNWTAPQAEKSSPTPETEQPCRKRPLRASGRACLGGGRGGHPTPDSWCLGLKWQLWPEGTDAGGGGGGRVCVFQELPQGACVLQGACRPCPGIALQDSAHGSGPEGLSPRKPRDSRSVTVPSLAARPSVEGASTGWQHAALPRFRGPHYADETARNGGCLN